MAQAVHAVNYKSTTLTWPTSQCICKPHYNTTRRVHIGMTTASQWCWRLSGKQNAVSEAATSWSETQASSLLLHTRPESMASSVQPVNVTACCMSEHASCRMTWYRLGIIESLVQVRTVRLCATICVAMHSP